MYVFTDPKVLENLQKIINAYSRFGEHIRLIATPTALQLSAVNASLTAIGTCTFAAPLFTGPGAQKNVHIKARAVDYVFKRMENEDISSLRLSFRTTRTGQEQLEIELACANSIKKLFRVACLNTAILPMDFEPEGAQPFTFECMPSVIKDALASCEAGADEVKVSFQHNLVNLLARKKGVSKGEFSAVRSGLRTIINLQPETFRQVTVATPRQLEFKLKEFRVMLAFFNQLGEEVPLVASFRQTGAMNTPLRFSNRASAYPGVEFVFKFMAKVSTPRVNAERPGMLRVGPQPDWLQVGPSRSNDTDAALHQARKERERRLRQIANNAQLSSTGHGGSPIPSPIPSPLASAQSTASAQTADWVHIGDSARSAIYGHGIGSAHGIELAHNVDQAPGSAPSSTPHTAENEDDFDASAEEVGLTQGPALVRGLFD